jgi:peptide methionine sulfoxide reductase msrA/msrB
MLFVCIAIISITGQGDDMNKDLKKTDAEWKEILTPEVYNITRKKGTERAFTGKYYDHKENGVYTCICCGKELFSSDNKYDSGCGWPSYWKALDNEAVGEQPDNSNDMKRTEIICTNCGAHLGHVFHDGPKPTGLRYCVNSASLNFVGENIPTNTMETATFGTGCFWCTEALFESIDGVQDVKAGYMGGETENPEYKQVCSGTTGHAEVAQISFDPKKISYQELLEIFWQVHDPTSLNKQGADEGTQYRSAIFYHGDDQKEQAVASMKESRKAFDREIVTEITEASKFYEAEDYHQDYYKNNTNAPYCRSVIAPKLKKFADKRKK